MKYVLTVLLVSMVFVFCGLSLVKAETISGIVAWWQFDEGEGNIIKDSSPNANNGEIHGATWTRGLFGSGLLFDGRNDYVKIPNSQSLHLTPKNQWTIEVWFYKLGPSNSSQWDSSRIIQKDDYYMRCLINQMEVGFSGVDVEWPRPDPDVVIWENKWYYVVGLFDGTDVKIFINGRLVKIQEADKKILTFSDGDLYIGCYTPEEGFFNGIIDEVKLYNRALAEWEIKMNYEQVKPGSNEFIDSVILRRDFKDNLCIYIKNYLKEPLEIDKIYVDEKDIEAITERDNIPIGRLCKGVVRWYDILPHPVPAGRWTELRIRFGTINEVGERVKIKLITKSGLIIQTVSEVLFSQVREFRSFSFDQEIRTLYLYASLENLDRIREVLIDGKDLTSRTVVRELNLEQGKLAFLTIFFPKSISPGYKIIKIITDKGSIACSVKVSSSFFPIGIYHVEHFVQVEPDRWEPASDERIEDCQWHRINTLGPYYIIDDPSGIKSSKYGMRYLAEFHSSGDDLISRIKQASTPSLWGYYVADEPSLGNASPMELLDYRNIFLKHAPASAVSVITNATYPAGCYEYNFSDVTMIDIYPFPNNPIAHTGIAIRNSREAVKPRPVVLIPQAFLKGNRTPARFPTSEEERLDVYSAVANGAKGVFYFMYDDNPLGMSHGISSSEPGAKLLWEEIDRINHELDLLAPLLLKGEPIPLAKVNQEKVEVSSILCGEDTIVVFLLNHNYEYKEMLLFYPVENVKVEIQLPDWLSPKEVFTVNYDQLNKIDFQNLNSKIVFNLSRLVVARALVVTSNEKLFAQMKRK